MAETDIKLSELTSRSGTLSPSALIYICVVDALSDTGFSSRKDTIASLTTSIFEDLEYPLKLNTDAKSIFAAINELAAGAAAVLTGTTTPAAATGEDGNLYVQYTEGTGGAPDTVDAIFVKLDGDWIEISTGGGPAETVLTETLEAGQTSVTFTDAAITTGANIRILTDVFGLMPTAATASTGTLTVSFTAQAADVEVRAVIY